MIVKGYIMYNFEKLFLKVSKYLKTARIHTESTTAKQRLYIQLSKREKK